MAGPEVVDRMNILQATFIAMRKAIMELGIRPDMILVDGSLKIPGLNLSQRAIVRGDSSEKAIAAASILAKTYRDDLMVRMEKRYPGYGFSRHKGYPTKEHISILERLGPCPIHRRSFQPVCNFISEKPLN